MHKQHGKEIKARLFIYTYTYMCITHINSWTKMSFEKLGSYLINSVKDLRETKMKKSDIMRDTIHYMSPASGRSLMEVDAFVASRSALEEPWLARSAMSVRSAVAPPRVTRSLLVIKPFAVQYEAVVLRKVQQHGFHIVQRRRMQLSAEQVCDFYLDPCDELNFPYSVLSWSNEPIVVVCVAAVDAVARLKKLAGSGTIHYSWFWPRAISHRFGYMESVMDALHTSTDEDSARREIHFFFPTMILEPLLHTETQVQDFLARTVKQTLLEGLAEVCKRKPVEPLLFLAEWLMLHNPYRPSLDPETAKLPN